MKAAFDLAGALRALDRVAALSLDVFDTAICRQFVDPSHLFLVWAVEGRQRDLLTVEPKLAASARIAAEASAREEKLTGFGTGEVSLDEIYAQLAAALGLKVEVSDSLKALEISLERRFSARNDEIFGLYEEARRRRLPVRFVSDMYLPVHVVKDLLECAGYAVGARELYVSHAHGCNKGDGLFPRVLADLGLPPRELLHVGDNVRSDQRVPRSLGIGVFPYRRIQDRGVAGSSPRFASASPVASFTASAVRQYRTKPQRDPFHEIGFTIVGPIFASYAAWLADELRRRPDCRTVYFASRDGHVLQQLYSKLAERDGRLPPAHYLYTSRRAIFLPSLEQLGDREMLALCVSRQPVTVEKLLDRIGLDPRSVGDAIVRSGLGEGAETARPLDLSRDGGRLRALFRDPAVRREMNELKEQERHLLSGYLLQEGLAAGGTHALVDIGWGASLQLGLVRFLDKTFPDERTLHGYYLSTFPRAAEAILPGRTTVEGYLCNLGVPFRAFYAFETFEELYEIAAMATHGTVLGYVESGGRIEPVLGEESFDARTLTSMKALQQGVLDFADALFAKGESLLAFASTDAHKDVMRDLAEQIALRPTVDQAEALGELMHNDGFGKELSMGRVAPSLRPGRWLRHPSEFMRALRSSFWQPGFLMRQPPVLREALLAGWGLTRFVRRLP